MTAFFLFLFVVNATGTFPAKVKGAQMPYDNSGKKHKGHRHSRP